MSDSLQKNRSGAVVLAAWLMIGYILSQVGYVVYEYIYWSHSDDWYRSFIFEMLPFVLFTVYLLFLYRRNRHNVLMPIAFTLAALLQLLGVWASVRSLRWMLDMNDDSSMRSHTQYQLFCLALIMIAFVAYALFAVDGFCKFRLRGVSRVMVLVLIGTTVVRSCVQLIMTLGLIGDSEWYFYPHPLVGMAMDLLFYGSLIVFFFGAVPKVDRAAPKAVSPCPTPVAAPVPYATVTYTTVSYGYVPPVTPAPARYCGHCGTPLHGAFCSNCGAKQ